MAKVSVLVAVYNREEFLPTCLDSLLRQTLRDIQVVCIDDASTDHSLQVLRSYAAADPRITVVMLSENYGQAYARNEGLKLATGTYTCFLDSDDWLSANALEEAVSVFEQYPDTDSVLFQVDIVRPAAVERYVMPPFESLSGREAFLLSLDWQIHGVYMVRTELHRRYPYDDTCRSFSDDNTTHIHYLHSRQVRQCQGVYSYRQTAQSTSNQITVRRFDRLRANESLKRQLMADGVDGDVLSQWETQRMLTLVDCYMFYFVHGRELPAADRRYGLSEMHRVWKTIDRTMLHSKAISKFGYRPMPAWWLFRLQEWLYFTLRGWMGKNR